MIRYILVLIAGFFVGVTAFVAVMIYNPFIADRGLSPISVSDAELMSLSFSNVASDSIVYTNDGESLHRPHPEKVLQLWEAPIRQTSTMATVVRDARGQVAGIGVKFSSDSERTSLLNGQAIVDSAWYIILPERGSLFVQQSENYWPFLREVAIPAWRSSSNKWRGTWLGDITAGPGALGTAKVTGGAGALSGMETSGVESLSAKAYSADEGHVAAEGRLLIEIPSMVSAEAPE